MDKITMKEIKAILKGDGYKIIESQSYKYLYCVKVELKKDTVTFSLDYRLNNFLYSVTVYNDNKAFIWFNKEVGV